jgi:transcriptional regulator with XRE-family HTH domain
MNVETLRDDCREYLKSHPLRQDLLAAEIGVPHSWLNKFINGNFANVRLNRLNRLCNWVTYDRVKRGLDQPAKRSA